MTQRVADRFRIVVVCALLAVCACTPPRQPTPVMETIVVPLNSVDDRVRLIQVLKRHAGEQSFRFVDVSDEQAEIDKGARTLWIGLYDGEDNRDLEIIVDNLWDINNPRVVFMNGPNVQRSMRSRVALTQEITRDWPSAQVFGPTPTGVRGGPNPQPPK